MSPLHSTTLPRSTPIRVVLPKSGPLYERSLAIWQKAYGTDHADVALALTNLAHVRQSQGRHSEAEQFYKRSLAIREKKFGPNHPDVAGSLSSLAGLYRGQKRYAAAEQLYERALRIRESTLGRNHPRVAMTLVGLAITRGQQKRHREAKSLLLRSLTIRERAFGLEHPQVSNSLNKLAEQSFVEAAWSDARSYLRRSIRILSERAIHTRSVLGRGLTGRKRSEAERSGSVFQAYIKAAYRLPKSAVGRSRSLAEEVFQSAQWAVKSGAADSLSKMAARHASDARELALLVRRRQDLVNEWQRRDRNRSAAIARSPAERNIHQEKKNTERLSDIGRQIAAIDKLMEREYANYVALANPGPLKIDDVQKLLKANEALVLFLGTKKIGPAPEEAFVWIVTKNASRWIRSELGQEELKDHVNALRCGLDFQGSWLSASAAQRCRQYVGLDYYELDHWAAKPLPFDLGRAHLLYKKLFGKAEDLISNKSLLIVASGPLSKLPLQTLVTSLPDNVATGQKFKEVARIGIEFKLPGDVKRAKSAVSVKQGALVVNAIADGPADLAGIERGDIILSVAGRPITAQRNLAQAVRGETPGSTVNVTLVRSEKRMTLKVKLGSIKVAYWQPYFLTAQNAVSTNWLVKKHAITILPSVSSLKALRVHARMRDAPKAFIGIGNPLLLGDGGFDAQAKLARSITNCAVAGTIRTSKRRTPRTAVIPRSSNGQTVDLAHLRVQAPLPETADELCAVARGIGASLDDVLLAGRATESSIKSTQQVGSTG